MKQKILLFFFLISFCQLSAQKMVYLPKDFTNDPIVSKQWSMAKSYQSDNFVVFWGDIVGADPTVYSNADLRFDPKNICDLLEASYHLFVTQMKFVSDSPLKNLGKYKIIIMMNDTWKGGGPSGWAFGGAYDAVIGAMWVNPGATRDGYVISHEFTHTLQSMISIQENPGGGFTNNDYSGWFWEAHANYMRCLQFPQFAGDDMPRWMATSMYHLSSTRHHYDTFRWLMLIQEKYGVELINRLWRESNADEHPLQTLMRLQNWNQAQLNDFLFENASRDVNCDYKVWTFDTEMRKVRNELKANEPHYLWRLYTMLDSVAGSANRYIVPSCSAPQDYGYNMIPLYTTCADKFISLKFKGHTEGNDAAGWRYGFVEVSSDGLTSRYSPVYNTDEAEISYKMSAAESQLYLVVMGAPKVHHSYAWEAGFPKIQRFPYEIALTNAVPEGFQPNFRSEYKLNGHAHSNGGGWVSNDATVDASVYVSPNALVRGSSHITGNVRIEDHAWIENATVSGKVKVSKNAQLYYGTYSGTSNITDNTILNYCTVTDNASFIQNAWAWGTAYGGSIVVGGDAEIGSCSSGVYLQCPHPNNNRTDCDGKGAGDDSNKDINAVFLPFSNAQMTFSMVLPCGGIADTQPPTVPTALKVDSVTYSNVYLSWNTSTDNIGVSAYKVVMNGSMETLTGNNCISVSGLTELTDYHFNVQAQDASGNWSVLSTGITARTSSKPVIPFNPNKAIDAIVTTSYVSPDEKLSAVNDDFVPTSSGDHSHGAYGDRNGDLNNEKWGWVQYTFNQAQTIKSSWVYWYTDGGGIALPEETSIQYWNGKLWVQPANVSGNGIDKNKFNITTFDPVTTQAMRLNFIGLASVGILEWKVLADDSPAGIITPTDQSMFQVYPNPFDHNQAELRIKFKSEITDPVTVKIIDLRNQVVYEEIVESGLILNIHKLFNPGVYIITLKTPQKEYVYTQKLIVE